MLAGTLVTIIGFMPIGGLVDRGQLAGGKFRRLAQHRLDQIAICGLVARQRRKLRNRGHLLEHKAHIGKRCCIGHDMVSGSGGALTPAILPADAPQYRDRRSEDDGRLIGLPFRRFYQTSGPRNLQNAGQRPAGLALASRPLRTCFSCFIRFDIRPGISVRFPFPRFHAHRSDIR
jgi:hypothetical protein